MSDEELKEGEYLPRAADPARPVEGTVRFGGRRTGKTAMMEEQMRKFTLKNPDAVIARCSIHGTRIEKPVKGTHEVVRPKRLEHNET